ncbi:MAG: cell division protein ZapA [Nitrospinae bacterium]|nr:cell division protein ZapA [Nitrospinota bacterium]MZH04944.1 cell division protein ZapA [Nitrospinota bacterium]MZH13543.1 cell division protein ZapA [Nitrospinota bacterium]
MAKIEIYGKTYNLKSSSGEISVEEAAAYVDAKMHELAEARKKTPSMDLAVLAALNIAQELLELQKEAGAHNQDQEEKIGRLIDTLENELQGIDY